MSTNLKSFLYRSCPRCGGDLALERPVVTRAEYSCVQCGRLFGLRAIFQGATEREAARPVSEAA